MKHGYNALLAATLVALNAAAQPAQPPAVAKPTNGPGGTSNAVPQPAPPQFRPPPPGRMAPNRPQPDMGPPPAMPATDKLSYAIGMNLVNRLKSSKLDVDFDSLIAAIKDTSAGHPTRMTEKEVQDTLSQLSKAMTAKMKAEREQQQAKMMADREKESSDNKAKGEEFLAKNAKAPGVQTLPNGLQYRVLAPGDGPMPKSTDTVTVNYKGRLIDGTVFDQRDNYTTRVTGQTIDGWSAILPLMKKGAKWEVTIPSEMGYKQRGFPPKIGANAVLIFDMELVSIAAPTKAAPPSVTAAPPTPHAPPPAPPTPSASSTPVVSGQIIRVPSKAEMEKGDKIEVITNAPGQ